MPETHRGRGRHSNRPGLGSHRSGGLKHPDANDTKNKKRGRSPLSQRQQDYEDDFINEDDNRLLPLLRRSETSDVANSPVEAHEKLSGSATSLRRTADFALQTGLKLQHGLGTQKKKLSKEDSQDPVEKLSVSLTPHLAEVSSQRLRCLHMTLRRLGNVDNRIGEKDMALAFQENNVSLPSRDHQQILDLYVDQQGIDYERLYACLVSAHNMTGRDSVKARRKRNDVTSRAHMTQDKRDADFLSRIESQLIRDQTFLDIDTLRAELQASDTQRSGKIKIEQIMLICQDKTPLYGALLENLLKRCDEDRNETVSWPTLLSFLERGQNAAREKDPELHLLPEKARATAAVNVAPDPISELSSGARNRLVNTLLRRASTRSAARAGSALSNAPSVVSASESRDPSPVDKALTRTPEESGHTDTKDKAVSFQPQSGDDKDANKSPQDPKEEADKPKSAGSTGRINLLSGMKRLLSGHNALKKKEEAAAESSKSKEEGSSPKTLPVIEVDKASESETSSKAELSTPSTPKHPPIALLAETTTTTTTNNNTSNNTTTTTDTKPLTISDSPTTSTTTSNNNNNSNNSTTADKEDGKIATTTTTDNKKREQEGGQSTAKDPTPTLTPSNSSTKVPVITGVSVLVPRDYTAPDVPVDPPGQRLQLEWVYGCRGNDCRRHVQSLESGELVYFISNVCVLLHRHTATQRHYKEHTEDVKCLAVHSNGTVVASGQFASNQRPEHVAHIRVWRADLLQTTHVLGQGSFCKAVMSLAFMPGKDILAAVDNSPDKRLTIWDLETKEAIAENYFVTDTVCDMEFNPKYPDLLVTCGKEHMQWWKVQPHAAKLLPFTVPDYESYLKAKYVVAAVHTDRGDLLTGDSNGTVYIWGDGGNHITNFVKHAHDGPVLSVLYHKGCLLTGGRDGKVCAWTWGRNMDLAASLHIPASEGGVRTLVTSEGCLVIATTMNSLLSLTMSTTSPCPLEEMALDPVPITQGHYDELRAVTVITDSFLEADVLTAGTDGVLCKFTSLSHSPVWKLYMKGMQFLCVSCSAKGDIIALGTRDGRVVQLEIDSASLQVMEILNEKVSTSSITSIALSPDNSCIAAGGEDNSIYVFRLSEKGEEGALGWNLSGILKGHDKPVVALDWTQQPLAEEVYLLRSSSATPEQKYWNVFSCLEVDGGQLATLTWASSTCTLDHLVTGVWRSKQAEKAKVTALDVNPQQNLVAMGNSLGLLSLYRFPCTKDKVFSHTYPAHQTVRALRFSPSGSCVFTVGGHDSALFQWKLI